MDVEAAIRHMIVNEIEEALDDDDLSKRIENLESWKEQVDAQIEDLTRDLSNLQETISQLNLKWELASLKSVSPNIFVRFVNYWKDTLSYDIFDKDWWQYSRKK